MPKRKIILDCDPGHDDAIAIMMAGKHPALELLGVTAVAGNQTLEKTAKNALKVCQYLDLDVPVCAGYDRPMVRSQIVAPNIHGESGMEGHVFGPLTKELDERHAVDFLIETLLASDGDITLVPTGPLTNVAMAMRREPKIVEKIDQIVLMGGAYELGNVTPAAEFNIYADPEAAHVVFHSGCTVVMMGLDLTRQVKCYPSIVERMKAINTDAAALFANLMTFYNKMEFQVFGLEGGPLHDPTCVAYLIDPSCMETKPMYTEVELRSELCYGRTVCDYFGVMNKEPNVQVCTKIDPDKFWDIVEECIRLYD